MSDSKKPVELAEERIKRVKGRQLVLEDADKVKQRPVQWLWPGRIAQGKMSLIAGTPGEGKTQIYLDVIARITREFDWPDGGKAPSGSAIILSAEDAADDTICPRLELAEADLTRVKIVKHVIVEGKKTSFSLKDDLEILHERIKLMPDLKVVMIDPLTAYLGETDSHRTSDVRSILEPVEKLAQESGVAFLCVTHPPKATQTKAMNAFTGSLAFAAAPRTTFLAVKEPESGRSLFLPVKNNLGPLAEGLGYRKQGGKTKAGIDTCRVIWDSKPVRLTADEAMQDSEPVSSEIRNAEKFLEALLKIEPLGASKIYAKAAEEGISERTLKRARKSLGIKVSKDGFQGSWTWKLP